MIRKLLIPVLILLMCFSVHAGVVIGNYYGDVSGCVGDVGPNTGIGGSDGATSLMYCTQFTQSGTCQINYMEFYQDDDASTEFTLWVYDDNGSDQPGNELAYTGSIASTAGFAWAGGSLNTAITLTDSVKYHFCFWADASINYKYDAGGTNEYYSGSYPTNPDPFSVSGTNTRNISIKGSYQ